MRKENEDRQAALTKYSSFLNATSVFFNDNKYSIIPYLTVSSNWISMDYLRALYRYCPTIRMPRVPFKMITNLILYGSLFIRHNLTELLWVLYRNFTDIALLSNATSTFFNDN